MKKIRKNFYITIASFSFLIVIGSLIYSSIEKWTFLDSLYFTIITITTIGYGDIHPVSPLGKIFTILFSFVGIAMAFYLFTLFSKYAYKKTFKKEIEKQHEKIKEHIDQKLKNLKKHTSKSL